VADATAFFSRKELERIQSAITAVLAKEDSSNA
jgi:hypothetical protein